MMLAAALLVMSCATSSSATPTPTIKPTPSPSALEILEKANPRMVVLETAHFTMVDEGETKSKFLNFTFQSMEGQVIMPDSFKLKVEVVAGFFLEIQIVAAGGQAVISNPFVEDEWKPIDIETLPFNFGNLGRTLVDIIPSIQDPKNTGLVEVDGVPLWQIEGVVPSESLKFLVTEADEGFQVTLRLGIGRDDLLLRRIRIEGQVFKEDSPEIVRVLTIDRFDEPVDIVLPETSGD